MSISALKEKFNSLTLESENHWDYRGNNNSERDYVHGFCTYPAMMVPKMQREMLDVCLEHLQDTSIRLLDPFAGSGTILVEGMLRGLNIVGIDINPLAILLCKAKTTILNPTTLHEKTVQLFTWITIHDKTPLYKFNYKISSASAACRLKTIQKLPRAFRKASNEKHVLNFFNCLIVACAMEYLQHLQKFREFGKRL